jgi:hypothetical protein
MDDARLLEIAAELEAGAEDGWAAALIEAEGVELSGSPKGFRTLAALLLRAMASDAVLYDRLKDLFGEQPAIYSLFVSWDAPPGWKPPETKMPLVFWLGLGLAVVLIIAVIVLAVIGFFAVIR